MSSSLHCIACWDDTKGNDARIIHVIVLGRHRMRSAIVARYLMKLGVNHCNDKQHEHSDDSHRYKPIRSHPTRPVNTNLQAIR